MVGTYIANGKVSACFSKKLRPEVMARWNGAKEPYLRLLGCFVKSLYTHYKSSSLPGLLPEYTWRSGMIVAFLKLTILPY